MKVGFSLGRCVRDIMTDIVTYDDVAFIITGTALRDEEAIKSCVDQYMYRDDYLYGLDEEQCQIVALDLWATNKILQPRRQGMHRHRQPENAVWVDMFPTVNSDSDAVKKAWDAYRLMIHMVENVDQEAMAAFK